MSDLALRPPDQLAQLGRQLDQAAAQRVFSDYRERQAPNTVRAQDGDLNIFAQFLAAGGVEAATDLATSAAGWSGLSWGLVAGFIRWQINAGYAVGTINRRLSTVKRYSALAAQAGALRAEELALIKTVAGYRASEGRRLDAQREKTRRGAKKIEATAVSAKQRGQLKNQDDLVDRLMMCVLFDHGLRVGELVLLVPTMFNLQRGTLTFWRPKVGKKQTHRLSSDTRATADELLPELPDYEPIWPSDREVRRRVQALGELVGLEKLSPHDCRHDWATRAAAAGTSPKALQDAGGWASIEMPMWYIQSAAIANEGVRLE